MTNSWRDTTIGREMTLQRGFDITRAQQRSGTVPVVSSSGISSFHDTAMVKGPGVVLGRKGVVGSVYFVDTDYWPHDTTLWVKDFKGNLPRFVYYFFRGMLDRIAGMDVGSANPTLNRNHVHPIEIRWPPPMQQRAIARFLGALDDKIEQNRRTARALERLARAIFRAWFVDFEPVKWKIEMQRKDAKTQRRKDATEVKQMNLLRHRVLATLRSFPLTPPPSPACRRKSSTPSPPASSIPTSAPCRRGGR